MVDPAAGATGDTAFLPGYDGDIAWGALMLVLFRLVLALYLISSALSVFDARRLATWEMPTRLGLAVLVLFKAPIVFGPAADVALCVIGWHRYASRRMTATM